MGWSSAHYFQRRLLPAMAALVLIGFSLSLCSLSYAQEPLRVGEDLGAYGYYKWGDRAHPDEVIYLFRGTAGDVSIVYEVWDVDYVIGDERVEILINGNSLGFVPITKNNDWSDFQALVLPEQFVNDSKENVLKFDHYRNVKARWQWAVRNVDFASDGGEKTLAWDANTEPDLAGYNIYFGMIARGIDNLEQIEKWCKAHEPNNDNCIEEWKEICPEPLDKNCHSMLFDYDQVINVSTQPFGENCTPYDPHKPECCQVTLTGFEIGKKYFFAATAYDYDDNESGYSKELSHVFNGKTKVNAAKKGSISINKK